MKLETGEQEQEITPPVPEENPTGYGKELLTDFVGFGGGALATFLGLEYGTASYMSGVSADKAVNTEWMFAGAKILGSLLVFGVTAKFVEKPHIGKKFLYGIGAGLLTSAGSDIVEATMSK